MYSRINSYGNFNKPRITFGGISKKADELIDIVIHYAPKVEVNGSKMADILFTSQRAYLKEHPVLYVDTLEINGKSTRFILIDPSDPKKYLVRSRNSMLPTREELNTFISKAYEIAVKYEQTGLNRKIQTILKLRTGS